VLFLNILTSVWLCIRNKLQVLVEIPSDGQSVRLGVIVAKCREKIIDIESKVTLYCYFLQDEFSC